MTGVARDIASTHKGVGNQLCVVEGLSEVECLSSPRFSFRVAPLILIEPTTELGVSIAEPKEIGPGRASGVTKAQLDDLELLLDDVDEVGRPDKAVGLYVLD